MKTNFLSLNPNRFTRKEFMPKELERRKLRKHSVVEAELEESCTPQKKKRYYNNPQNKKVRERREIRGPK
jgi:hypothetical protein